MLSFEVKVGVFESRTQSKGAKRSPLLPARGDSRKTKFRCRRLYVYYCQSSYYFSSESDCAGTYMYSAMAQIYQPTMRTILNRLSLQNDRWEWSCDVGVCGSPSCLWFCVYSSTDMPSGKVPDGDLPTYTVECSIYKIYTTTHEHWVPQYGHSITLAGERGVADDIIYKL